MADSSFLFSTINMSFHYLLTSMVLLRNPSKISLRIFYIGQVASVFLFLRFFPCLLMLWSRVAMDLFEFTFLAVHSAAWMCRFMYFMKFGKLLAMLSSNTFSAPFSLFVLGFHNTYVVCLIVGFVFVFVLCFCGRSLELPTS